MMPRALTPCLNCGNLTRAGGRCEPCRRAKERKRSAERREVHDATYDTIYRRNRRAVLEAQPWCSRCGSTSNLTVDHVVPAARGGTSDPSNLQTLCRFCNSSKKDR